MRAEADDPAGDEGLEGGEDGGVEAIAERPYQRGEAGNKLVHGAGLRLGLVPGRCGNPQDTESVRDGPLFSQALRQA